MLDVNRDPRTYAVIGAAMEVHNQLGCGFLEPVYQEALAMEFDIRRLPYQREAELPVFYKGKRLSTNYRPDFVCYDALVVELKALAKLGGVEESQTLNYMKAGSFATGLLLNFGAKTLEHRRLVLTPSAKSADALSVSSSETPSVESVKSADVLSGSLSGAPSAKSADGAPSVRNPSSNLRKEVR
ncbi:MAG: GxxExxY protein [Deltaproteobacteria bacterium]|nr:GxxExxY protein [Deltaproteobacteria bacterium]